MRARVGIYFDDNHNVLEAPTMWAMAVSKIRSRSDETTRNYANILRRFLQWLDDSPIEGVKLYLVRRTGSWWMRMFLMPSLFT